MMGIHNRFIRVAVVLVILAVSIPWTASAKSLGVFGRTYDIIEVDALDQIMADLEAKQTDGTIDRINKEMQERAEQYAHRPKGALLPTATVKRTHYFNPTVKYTDPIVDADGRVLFPMGTSVNPLEYMSMTRPWVFFDADNEEQTEWVYRLIQDRPYAYSLVMINGNIIDMMKLWQTRIYFDQYGKYVEKLNLQALPAVMYQEGKVLRIDEVPPSEEIINASQH
jgi:conjugal transfer pilus assembly protein TraW